MRALIDGDDPVVTYGLAQRIKYARLIRRPVSSPNAQGADCQGYRYVVQLALAGTPYHKPKHTVGADTIGLDLGPSSMAIVPHQAEARLEILAGALIPDEHAIRRLQRKMDRQRRAANPKHYDEQGRPKKRGKQGLHWNQSKGYQATRRRKATQERKLKAHRKSVHGRTVYEIVALGKTICIEKISYKGWQKRYGKSVGLRCTGTKARATKPPDGAKPRKNASSKRIARACMDAPSMRSSRWARRSASKRSPTRVGRNATAKAWAYGLQGC